MSVEKRNRSHPSKPRPVGREVSPTALLHAKMLVRSHGACRSREIVRVNASLDEDDPYWSSVLQAIGEIKPLDPPGSDGRCDLPAPTRFLASRATRLRDS